MYWRIQRRVEFHPRQLIPFVRPTKQLRGAFAKITTKCCVLVLIKVLFRRQQIFERKSRSGHRFSFKNLLAPKQNLNQHEYTTFSGNYGECATQLLGRPDKQNQLTGMKFHSPLHSPLDSPIHFPFQSPRSRTAFAIITTKCRVLVLIKVLFRRQEIFERKSRT